MNDGFSHNLLNLQMEEDEMDWEPWEIDDTVVEGLDQIEQRSLNGLQMIQQNYASEPPTPESEVTPEEPPEEPEVPPEEPEVVTDSFMCAWINKLAKELKCTRCSIDFNDRQAADTHAYEFHATQVVRQSGGAYAGGEGEKIEFTKTTHLSNEVTTYSLDLDKSKFYDAQSVINALRPEIERVLREQLESQRDRLKVQLAMHYNFVTTKPEEVDIWFNSFMHILVHPSRINTLLDVLMRPKLDAKVEEWNEKGSGLICIGIDKVELTTMKFSGLSGSEFEELPAILRQKTKSLLNVNNSDEFVMRTTKDPEDAKKCFLWSVLAGLKNYQNLYRARRFTTYKKFEETLNLEGLEWPMTLDQIPKFEKQNKNIGITVLMYEWIEAPEWQKPKLQDLTDERDVPRAEWNKYSEYDKDRWREVFKKNKDIRRAKELELFEKERKKKEIQDAKDLVYANSLSANERAEFLAMKAEKAEKDRKKKIRDRGNRRSDAIRENCYPVYITSHQDYDPERKYIDLLLVEHRENKVVDWAINSHFVLIRDLGALIRRYGYGKRFLCRHCLQGFRSQKILSKHIQRCRLHGMQKVEFKDKKELKFQNFKAMLEVPFMFAVDFEAFIQKQEEPVSVLRKLKTHYMYEFVEKQVKGKTFYQQKHKMCGYSWMCVKSDGTIYDHQTYHLNPSDEATGVDVTVKCLDEIMSVSNNLVQKMKELEEKADKVMLFDNLSPSAADSTVCWFCDGRIPASEDEVEIEETGDEEVDSEKRQNEFFKWRGVRHHDHWTLQFIGWAHNHCNFQADYVDFIPVICHNLTSYDGHAFVRAYENSTNAFHLNVIPISTEKFMGLSFNYHTKFIDSLKFMTASLGKLVAQLAKSGPGKFPLLRDMVVNKYGLSEDKLDLLLRKGVYCYERMTNASDFNMKHLPPIEEFYSELMGEGISQEDYDFGKLVFKEFRCKNMGDYHDLYVETDTRQLLDVFLNWRKMFLEKFKIDCCHYWSLPGLSWDCALKYSKVEMHYIQDINMHLFIEKALRGGLSCGGSLRYAKANSKYTSSYDSTKPEAYIQYVDMNSLYPTALSYKLPVRDFRFLKAEETRKKFQFASNIMRMDADGEKGYFLAVDVEFPAGFHDKFDDFPIFPVKRQVGLSELSKFQIELIEKLNIHQNCLKAPKLVADLNIREDYVVHIKHLQYALSLGVKLRKVRKVLEFTQDAWLGDYISWCVKNRQEASTDFEKDMWKLSMNCLYGKSCESKRDRLGITVLKRPSQARRCAKLASLRNVIPLSENLVLAVRSATACVLDRPIYVGAACLEISKLLMIDFWYEYIKKNYRGNAKLLFTDTDSICYYLEGKDPYVDMVKSENCSRFDLSAYPADHPTLGKFHNNKNYKVLGKMKDEAGSAPIIEFVFLKPKCYSYLDDQGKEGKRAKGIPRQTLEKTHAFETYKSVLFDGKETNVNATRISSLRHDLYTVKYSKRGVNPIDTKRFNVDGIHTMAFGHDTIKRMKL